MTQIRLSVRQGRTSGGARLISSRRSQDPSRTALMRLPSMKAKATPPSAAAATFSAVATSWANDCHPCLQHLRKVSTCKAMCCTTSSRFKMYISGTQLRRPGSKQKLKKADRNAAPYLRGWVSAVFLFLLAVAPLSPSCWCCCSSSTCQAKCVNSITRLEPHFMRLLTVNAMLPQR